MNDTIIDTLKKVVGGGLGITGIQVAENLPQHTNLDEVLKCAIQVLVGIVTIYSLLMGKKRKK
jgi:hypothetical protein